RPARGGPPGDDGPAAAGAREGHPRAARPVPGRGHALKEAHMPTAVATGLLVLLAAADRKVALVLEVRGAVTVQDPQGAKRPLEVAEMLYNGDRLTAPAGGGATLLILGDKHRERLKPGFTVTVTASGCGPAGAVEKAA